MGADISPPNCKRLGHLCHLQGGSTEPDGMQQPRDYSSAPAGLREGRNAPMPRPPAEPDLQGFITLVPRKVHTTLVWIKAQIYPCHNIHRRKTREQPTNTNRKKCYTCRAQTLPLDAKLLYYWFVNMIRDREDRIGLLKPGKIVRYFPHNCKDVNAQNIEAAEIDRALKVSSENWESSC